MKYAKNDMPTPCNNEPKNLDTSILKVTLFEHDNYYIVLSGGFDKVATFIPCTSIKAITLATLQGIMIETIPYEEFQCINKF